MSKYKIPAQRCKLVRDGAAIPSPVESVSCCEDAIRFFREYYARECLPHERIVALFVNAQKKIVGFSRVADGGQHGCAMTPKDALRAAVVANAGAMILAHNHPSGCADPSVEDIELTHALKKACDIMGIPLLDHVIVGADRATSLREMGVV